MSAVAGAGGEPSLGGAGDDSGFPWPTEQPERGAVSGIDAWDAVQPGCCSRVPNSAAATTCPAGDGAREVASFDGGGNVPVEQIQVETERVLDRTVWLQVRSQHPTQLGVVRTSVPPPANIIDLSAVYWIGANGSWPTELHVGLPADSGAGIGTLNPSARRVQVYYSTDGVDYVGLTTDNLAAPAMAFMPGPGFVVTGAGPNTISCE